MKILALFFTLAISLVISAQFNPEPKKVTQKYFPENESIEEVTPALKKKKGFTNHEELLGFLNDLKTKFPNLVEIKLLGQSQNGLDIPMILIGNGAKDSSKVRVWIQGGLHGNEPASTEGVLYLTHQLLNNKNLAYLTDRLQFAIVPMANIDGYLKQDRYASNGLDLNRDQTKLMAKESVILKQAYSNYNPHVALDFHEYNAYRKDFASLASFGITSAFDVMFLYSNNLNVPENLRKLIDTSFVEGARKAMDQHQLKHHDYVSTKHSCGEIIFSQGSSSARSSASSYALSNAVAALIEVRGVNIGRTSFKRRINTTYLVGLAFIENAYAQHIYLKEQIQIASKSCKDVVVKAQSPIELDTLDVISLENFELIQLPIKVQNAKSAEATLSRNCPDAYILPKSLAYLADKIRVLGLEVKTLETDTTMNVECYRIDAYSRENEPYEQIYQQTVSTQIETKQVFFPKGTYFISTQQKNKGLLFETLEPEAPNSFVSFGVLSVALNDEIPIYRYFQNAQN